MQEQPELPGGGHQEGGVERVERRPPRKNVVSCDCVCRTWREITMAVVRSPPQSGKITFPSFVKQPGPRDPPLKCFIRRDKKNWTFYLYLGSIQTLMDNEELLLAARRFRRGAHTEYIISLDADDLLSQGSNAYVGKLSSDFWGRKFTIYDNRPPFDGVEASSSRASCRFTSKRVSPQVPSGNFEIGQVSYKLNLLRSGGPRRMMCSLQCPSARENTEEPHKYPEATSSGSNAKPMILKNKAPRWHEHLQNFQLLAPADPTQTGGQFGDEETVLLQFGKVGDDMFTMDYRHPLSAFQAFAICLTSFDARLGL